MYYRCISCGKDLNENNLYKKYDLIFCSKKCIKIEQNKIKLEPNIQFKGSSFIEQVKEKDNMGHNRYYFKLKCNCDNIFSQRRDYAMKQIISNKILSCGCVKNTHPIGKKSSKWSGYGDISGWYFSSIKCKAKKKNILFEITIEYLWNLFLKQNKKCSYTNLDLKFATSRRINPEQTASLDRIDSDKGYTKDNIQWVHKNVNYMKRSMSHNEFIKFCKLVSKNS